MSPLDMVTRPHLKMILNLLLPLIQCLAVLSITNLLGMTLALKAAATIVNPNMMAPQGYSVSGSAGMRPGSAGGCGRDQGSAEDYGGSAGRWKQSQAVDIRATEFPNLTDHLPSVSFFAILGAGDFKNFSFLAQIDVGRFGQRTMRLP